MEAAEQLRTWFYDYFYEYYRVWIKEVKYEKMPNILDVHAFRHQKDAMIENMMGSSPFGMKYK